MRFLRRRPALKLFCGAFLVYNLNLRPISSGDTAPAALLPLTLWLEGKITLEKYASWLAARYPKPTYFFFERGGRTYSNYPVAQPLLLAPLYSPLALAPGLRQWPVESLVLLARVLEKLAASLVAALAVVLFYRLARRLTDGQQAVWLALVLALGTSVWSISSQALWQHGMGQLMIIASLLCLHRHLKGEGGWLAWAGAGLCAALSAAVRPTNVMFVVACCAVLLVRPRWKPLGSYALFGAVIGGAVAAYNLTIFGLLTGGYPLAPHGNILKGLAGLLFSPSRGLLVYSPVFLLLLPAAWLWRRWEGGPERRVIAVAVVFAVGHTLIHASWLMWWGGNCFGPRPMSEVLPGLVLLLVPVLEWQARKRTLRLAFLLLAALSVGVQFVGAFCYPMGDWHSRPAPVLRHWERLWDWRDNPIRRDLAAGLNLKGYAAAGELVAARWEGRRPELEKIGLHVQ